MLHQDARNEAMESVAEAASLGIMAQDWENIAELHKEWNVECRRIHPSNWPVCSYCGCSSLGSNQRNWKAAAAPPGQLPPYASVNMLVGDQCFAANGSWHTCP